MENPIYKWMIQGSGKLLHNYGKSPFFMGKSTIPMAMSNSFLYVYQRATPINGTENPPTLREATAMSSHWGIVT
jgi:hypothetical protein